MKTYGMSKTHLYQTKEPETKPYNSPVTRKNNEARKEPLHCTITTTSFLKNLTFKQYRKEIEPHAHHDTKKRV